jgi:hypothetical protein
MASQRSDKLKEILAQAQHKARAAQAAQAAAPALTETDRIESLLDRNEALPDSRALARLYRSKDLVERLPDDEDSATPASPAVAPEAPSAPLVAESPEPAPGDATGAPDPAQAARQAPARPPLSPAQIREVMNELREQFTSGTYMTYEAKPNPVDVIPMPEDDYVAPEPVEETNELFYVVGAVIALAVIGIFVLLAFNGPLRYRPPAGGAAPSPSASANR